MIYLVSLARVKGISNPGGKVSFEFMFEYKNELNTMATFIDNQHIRKPAKMRNYRFVIGLPFSSLNKSMKAICKSLSILELNKVHTITAVLVRASFLA